MVNNTKADAVLVSERDLLQAKDKVVVAVKEFLRVGHEGETVSGDLQNAGRRLVDALEEHDKLI